MMMMDLMKLINVIAFYIMLLNLVLEFSALRSWLIGWLFGRRYCVKEIAQPLF